MPVGRRPWQPCAQVLGVDVGTRPDLDEQVPAKAAEAAALAGRPEPPALSESITTGSGPAMAP